MANSRALKNIDDIVDLGIRIRRVHSGTSSRTIVAIQDEIARLNRRGTIDNDGASQMLDFVNRRRRSRRR